MTTDRQTRKRRSDNELQKAAYHLQYARDMFRECGLLLQQGSFKQHPIFQNALMESFFAQARNLLDFYYPTTPTPDDVIAADYFDQPGDWTQRRPPLTLALKQVRFLVRKEAGHITYSKVKTSPKARRWHFPTIYQDMQQVLSAFVEHVPKQRLDPGLLRADMGILEEAASRGKRNKTIH